MSDVTRPVPSGLCSAAPPVGHRWNDAASWCSTQRRTLVCLQLRRFSVSSWEGLKRLVVHSGSFQGMLSIPLQDPDVTDEIVGKKQTCPLRLQPLNGREPPGVCGMKMPTQQGQCLRNVLQIIASEGRPEFSESVTSHRRSGIA